MLLDESIHFSLSVIVGAIVGYFTQQWWAVPIALATGFFIDVDHFIDYFLFTKFRRFSLHEFTSGKFFDYSGKVYVLLHGFEYSVILIILGVVYPQLGWLFYSLGFSNLLHLLYDTCVNGAVWPTYFITFRAVKNFDHKKMWINNEK